MIRYSAFILSIFIINGCSIFGASEKLFPEKKYDFLEEKIEDNISLPGSLDDLNTENHYPVIDIEDVGDQLEVPKPRQIFASSGNSSVQLRRLGELMWIYIETLPSTSWPISKNYWDTSALPIIFKFLALSIIFVLVALASLIKSSLSSLASTRIFLLFSFICSVS